MVLRCVFGCCGVAAAAAAAWPDLVTSLTISNQTSPSTLIVNASAGPDEPPPGYTTSNVGNAAAVQAKRATTTSIILESILFF